MIPGPLMVHKFEGRNNALLAKHDAVFEESRLLLLLLLPLLLLLLLPLLLLLLLQLLLLPLLLPQLDMNVNIFGVSCVSLM